MKLINLKIDRHRAKGIEKQGISLFVVISALLILSVLTISVAAQLMAPAFSATTAVQQLSRENEFRSALRILRPLARLASSGAAATISNLPELDGSPYAIKIDERLQTFSFQDVNGLIDVNSASGALLSSFLAGIGKADRLDAVLQYRSQYPFKNVDEFLALLEMPNGEAGNLRLFLTISSGQRRINGQTAPQALLQILGGNVSNRAQLIAQIDKRFLRVRPVTNVLIRQVH